MGTTFIPVTILAMVVMVTVSSTPLDDYVNAPDDHYQYKLLATHNGLFFKMHVLNMTSQKWMDESTSDRSIWWHYVTIIIPDRLTSKDSAFLYVGGQNNHGTKPPTLTDGAALGVSLISVMTGTIMVSLQQVPNEPITFKADPTRRSRKEDDIISFTWKLFLENGSNPEVLLNLPMTKAVVRTMDTVDDYCQKETHTPINRFFLVGASKRGWATWLTAAVDKRVKAFMPVAMDLLNMRQNFRHHFQSLGGYSSALENFYRDGLLEYFDTEKMDKLAAIIDPMTYNDRYASIPKCIMGVTGDEFFLLDNSHYYYDQLSGPKHLRMVPNIGHVLQGGEAKDLLMGLSGFYMDSMKNTDIPTLRWQAEQTEAGTKLTLWTDKEPTTTTVWSAHTAGGVRRDFRGHKWDSASQTAVAQNVTWYKSAPTRISATQYEAEMLTPEEGWTGFFIEAKFGGGLLDLESSLDFTTQVYIVPDTFPFDACDGDDCNVIV